MKNTEINGHSVTYRVAIEAIWRLESKNMWGQASGSTIYQGTIEGDVVLVRAGLGGQKVIRATTLEEAQQGALEYWKSVEETGKSFSIEKIAGEELERLQRRSKTIEITYWSAQMLHGFADAVSASGMASRYACQNPEISRPVEHVRADWRDEAPRNIRATQARILEYVV